jgi:LemA protein
MIVGLVLLGLVVFVIGGLIYIYNQLVRLKNQFLNAFSQIDIQLKRRYDLIPNLVDVAKKYLEHEKETLIRVIAARDSAAAALSDLNHSAASADGIKKLAQSENMLSKSMGQFSAVMENYPDLKANTQLTQLMDELSHTENRIAFARQAYNDQVMFYNTYKQSFPQHILAQWFGHTKDAALLEFDDKKEIQQAPKIQM